MFKKVSWEITPNTFFKFGILTQQNIYLCNKKHPEPSKIQTGVNELYEVIKRTPNSFFKQIQNLKTYPNA